MTQKEQHEIIGGIVLEAQKAQQSLCCHKTNLSNLADSLEAFIGKLREIEQGERRYRIEFSESDDWFRVLRADGFASINQPTVQWPTSVKLTELLDAYNQAAERLEKATKRKKELGIG